MLRAIAIGIDKVPVSAFPFGANFPFRYSDWRCVRMKSVFCLPYLSIQKSNQIYRDKFCNNTRLKDDNIYCFTKFLENSAFIDKLGKSG
jgi:hypothetical protein